MVGVWRTRRERIILEANEIGVSGERHYADAIERLLAEYGGGMREYRCTGLIRRDRGNSHDPHAVEVVVHGVRVGYISKTWSETVSAKIKDREVEMKCILNWNGESPHGIYHVKLLPLF